MVAVKGASTGSPRLRLRATPVNRLRAGWGSTSAVHGCEGNAVIGHWINSETWRGVAKRLQPNGAYWYRLAVDTLNR
jgi:hypothetical protein